MRTFVLLGLAACGTEPSPAPTSAGTACDASDVPQVSFTEPDCAGGGVAEDLYATLAALDADGAPCPDGVCAGGVSIEATAHNPCDVPIDVDLGCPPFDRWSVDGPAATGATPGCPTPLLTVASLAPGGSVSLGALALPDLAAGFYTFAGVTAVAGEASVPFCLQD